MFLPDTNVLIAAINETDARLAARFDSEIERGTPIVLSSLVVFELRFGVAHSARRERNRARLDKFLMLPFTPAPFEDEDAEHAGDVRALLKRLGTPIGPYDLLIAAQARRRGAVLVTANAREFGRVPDLKVEDWSSQAT